MKIIPTMLAICAAILLSLEFSAAHAAGNSGHCVGLMQTDFINSDANDTTTSTAWQNITDGYRNFVQGSDGCVVITLSGPAQVTGYAGRTLEVQTLLDGKSTCAPANFNTGVLDNSFAAFSTTRICEHVAAGPHTIQVQYREIYSPSASLLGHVLTVMHN